MFKQPLFYDLFLINKYNVHYILYWERTSLAGNHPVCPLSSPTQQCSSRWETIVMTSFFRNPSSSSSWSPKTLNPDLLKFDFPNYGKGSVAANVWMTDFAYLGSTANGYEGSYQPKWQTVVFLKCQNIETVSVLFDNWADTRLNFFQIKSFKANQKYILTVVQQERISWGK